MSYKASIHSKGAFLLLPPLYSFSFDSSLVRFSPPSVVLLTCNWFSLLAIMKTSSAVLYLAFLLTASVVDAHSFKAVELKLADGKYVKVTKTDQLIDVYDYKTTATHYTTIHPKPTVYKDHEGHKHTQIPKPYTKVKSVEVTIWKHFAEYEELGPHAIPVRSETKTRGISTDLPINRDILEAVCARTHVRTITKCIM